MSKPNKANAWTDTLNTKVRLLHRDITGLRDWMEKAGADEELIKKSSAGYYKLLDSIYEEDFPLAKAMDSSDLLLLLEGSALKTKSPRISLIASVFSNVRKQVGSVAHALSGVLAQKMLPKDVDLGLSAYSTGSLYLGFSLPDPNAPNEKGQTGLFGPDDPLYKATKIAIQTIGVVTQKLDAGASENAIKKAVPDPKLRDAALVAIEQLAPSGKMGIDIVSLGGRGMAHRGFKALTPVIKRKLRQWVAHPVKSAERAKFEGIIREIDLDVTRFDLRRIAGSSIEDIRCIYPRALEAKAKAYLDQKVVVTGTVDRSSDGKPKLLEVQTLDPFAAAETVPLL